MLLSRETCLWSSSAGPEHTPCCPRSRPQPRPASASSEAEAPGPGARAGGLSGTPARARPLQAGAPGLHEDRCILARGGFLSQGSSNHLGAATEEDPEQVKPPSHRSPPPQHRPCAAPHSPAPDAGCPAPYREGPSTGEAPPNRPRHRPCAAPPSPAPSPAMSQQDVLVLCPFLSGLLSTLPTVRSPPSSV